jgi:hypothetical protein
VLISAGFGEVFADYLFVTILNYVGLGLFALATILTVISGVNYIIKNIQVLKA